ncbi:MAG: dienelactone hydrolase family protein [Bacteroidales bacterium]|nr:dienelactone hydrolase family protein [Bacteroidales bacterium]
MKYGFLVVFCFLFINKSYNQQKVYFYSADSLKITADLFLKDYSLPYILLFHQGGFSRGEFREIAGKLMKFNYNCLAVDLRAGDKVNYVRNETAQRAHENNIPHQMIDAKSDILAAINYVSKNSDQPMVLFGSSFSASLCILAAKNNEKVKAVIAFSPGEYFRPEIIVKDELDGFDKPVFVSSSDLEYTYILDMFSSVPSKQKTIFKPYEGKGIHGAKALWDENEYNGEYWMELIRFFKKIKDS